VYEHYLKALQVSKLNNTPLISLTNTSNGFWVHIQVTLALNVLHPNLKAALYFRWSSVILYVFVIDESKVFFVVVSKLIENHFDIVQIKVDREYFKQSKRF
jgi:hypothetical protein